MGEATVWRVKTQGAWGSEAGRSRQHGKELLMVTHCEVEFRPKRRTVSEGKARLEQHLSHTPEIVWGVLFGVYNRFCRNSNEAEVIEKGFIEETFSSHFYPLSYLSDLLPSCFPFIVSLSFPFSLWMLGGGFESQLLSHHTLTVSLSPWAITRLHIAGKGPSMVRGWLHWLVHDPFPTPLQCHAIHPVRQKGKIQAPWG